MTLQSLAQKLLAPRRPISAASPIIMSNAAGVRRDQDLPDPQQSATVITKVPLFAH
jgi:hypothetical protein